MNLLRLHWEIAPSLQALFLSFPFLAHTHSVLTAELLPVQFGKRLSHRDGPDDGPFIPAEIQKP